ncbi:MAG: FtsX-like permease family protein, partial [Duncaniella sp.]|nr:FtsX-like permease family protein [Duncaniella sp.]
GIMKLSEPFDKNYRKLDKFLSDNFPACDFKLDTMERRTRDLYKELYTNRNSALVSTIALVFIALMGLLGFTADEVERRRKEIAIRKVNGATSATVISLICGDVLKVSVPAVVIGTAIAWYVGSLWIQEFTVRVEYLPVYFILSAVSILAFVVICVALVTRRVANENPVNQLKSE